MHNVLSGLAMVMGAHEKALDIDFIRGEIHHRWCKNIDLYGKFGGSRISETTLIT